MSDHYAVAEDKATAIQKAFEERERRRKERITRIIRERNRTLQGCRNSRRRQEITKTICAEDPITFINDWVWTHDPRNAGTDLPVQMPFKLRPRQEDLVRWLEGLMNENVNGLIEKSRTEGATYTCLAYGLHQWLFEEGFSMAVGSRKLELVDKKGDLDALLPKIRYMLYRLPEWMRPEDFKPDEHDNFTRLINPKKESSISGEAGENMGRGGRSTWYVIDEWAYVKQQKAVNAAVSDNAKVHVKLSTPSGSQDQMHQEKHSGRYRVFTLHWQDNPVKNFTAGVQTEDGVETIYPWYEREQQNKDPVTLAQEVDIDYGAAAENVIIPSKLVRAAVNIDIPPGAVRRAGLDVSEGRDDATVWVYRAGPEVRSVKAISSGSTNQVDTVERLCNEAGIHALYYDRMGVGAQITATLKKREDELDFEVIGITNSDRPTNRKFRDRPEVPADERFNSYAAELWWALRLRFMATYEVMEGIGDHPPSDCISIPERSTLITQLSQPTYSKTAAGKIKVDKFGEGNSSPDEAEGCMYAFAEPASQSWETVSTVHANVN